MKLLNGTSILAITLSALALIAGCQTAPNTQAQKDVLDTNADAALSRFKSENSDFANMVSHAYGYVVFPSIGKGGVIVGGAYGRGIAYEQMKKVGFADLTQGTIGAQLGGQTFAEIVVFETKEAMQRFENNQFAFSANASAIAINAGAGAGVRYDNGVAVFLEPIGGLMLEASIGGQKFGFVANSTAADMTSGSSYHSTETKTETTTH